MVDKITHMADLRNDNTLITPENTLLEVLSDIKSGKRICNKILILCLDDEEDKYNTSMAASNLKTSEMISLISRYNHIFNTWMN